MAEQLVTAAQNTALWIGVAGVLSIVFLIILTAATPHSEWKLIREGNCAAATSLIGSFLGFLLPLAVVIVQTHKIADLVLWACMALVVQLAVFFVLHLVFKMMNMSNAMAKGNNAAGIFMGGMSLGAGIINAAVLVS